MQKKKQKTKKKKRTFLGTTLIFFLEWPFLVSNVFFLFDLYNLIHIDYEPGERLNACNVKKAKTGLLHGSV